MGTFRNEAIRRLFMALGVVVAVYLVFVMMPIAEVLVYSDGVLKSGLRLAIEGRLHWLGIV